MYKSIITKNPDTYNEAALNERDNAFLQGVICTKNSLSDMLTKYFAEEVSGENKPDESTLEDFLSYFEDEIEEFEAEFIVTMINSYQSSNTK